MGRWTLSPLWPSFCNIPNMFRDKHRPHHLTLGERGERIAVRYLRLRGYRILERNYRCRLGEIDIISSKRGTMVFVEVRTRRESLLADPIGSIDGIKALRIIHASRYYVLTQGWEHSFLRFDIVGIIYPEFRRRPLVSHLINAFDLDHDTVVRGRILRASRMRRRFFPGRKRKFRGR